MAPGTIKDLVDRATLDLSRAATETPRLDAEVLMTFALGWSRARLFAHWDEPAGVDVARTYGRLVERRTAGEPVAYIRGFKEFLGLEFLVDSRVLIPRPETELLVARAVSRLEGTSGATVVDVGTGSGAIAIGIALSCPDARVLATDLSEGALQVAAANARRFGVAPRFVRGSLLEPLTGPFDLVVANLPYLSQDDCESLAGTSISFEPRLALTDGADGLSLFELLFAQVSTRMRAGGTLLLEFGAGQEGPLARLARRRLPGFEAAVFADYSGLPRVLQLSAPAG